MNSDTVSDMNSDTVSDMNSDAIRIRFRILIFIILIIK